MKKDDIAIVVLVIIFSPILVPILLVILAILWLFYKDPHIECEKGNHKFESIVNNKDFSRRCKACGLLG
jgi:hypothetical protein